MIDIAAIFKYKNRILRQIPARDRILRKIFQKEFKLKSKEKKYEYLYIWPWASGKTEILIFRW